MWEIMESLGFTKWEPMDFVNNLQYMLVGMLGILLVIGVIILLTYGVNAFGVALEKKKKDKE